MSVTIIRVFLSEIIMINMYRCNLEDCRTLSVKSKHHFRACLEPLSREIRTVDGGGLGSVFLYGGNSLYNNVRRPIWPLDNFEYPLS